MKVSRPHVFSNMRCIWSMILPDSVRLSSMYLFHRKFFTPQTAYRTFARARISVQDLIRKKTTICAKHVTNARGHDFDFSWALKCLLFSDCVIQLLKFPDFLQGQARSVQ